MAAETFLFFLLKHLQFNDLLRLACNKIINIVSGGKQGGGDVALAQPPLNWNLPHFQN